MSTEPSPRSFVAGHKHFIPVVALAMLCIAGPRPLCAKVDKKVRDSILADAITAGEADADRPARTILSRLKMDLGFTTLTIGGGVLVDYAMYDQDSASRDQFNLVSIGKLRDARILMGGRFKHKRPLT